MQQFNMRMSDERALKLEALQSLGPFPATKTIVVETAIDALFRQLIGDALPPEQASHQRQVLLDDLERLQELHEARP